MVFRLLDEHIYCHLLQRITPDYRKRPERLLKVLAALGKAVFFDIEIFTAVFMHAVSPARRRRRQMRFRHRSPQSSEATQHAAAAIAGISRTIGQVSEIAGAIATAVDQQRNATQEIARNVQEVAHSSGIANGNMTAVTDFRRTDRRGRTRGPDQRGRTGQPVRPP